MSVTWLAKEELMPIISDKLEKVAVVLDIGCGIVPQQYIKPAVHICCEPFEQYIDHLLKKNKNTYNRAYVVLQVTWAEAIKIFPAKSVDTVFLLDVVEHLEKKEALKLLEETQLLARRQVVVFTPLGFMPQSHPDGKDAWGLDGGSWQEHKSGWQPDDFLEWDIFASKIFYTRDNMGRELETPFGAFWAIKNFNDPVNESAPLLRRKKIYAFVDKSLDFTERFVNKFVRLLRLNR